MKKSKKKIFLYILFALLIISVSFLKSFAVRVVNTTVTITEKVFTSIQWAIPELRAGEIDTNNDTNFYLTARDPASHQILFVQPVLLSTDNEGKYSDSIDMLGIIPGVYDVGIKTTAHLTKIIRNVPLNPGINVLNFTQLDNSVSKGSVRLVAGDISGEATSPSNSGDDVINSSDLSLLIDYVDLDDPSGNMRRANLNQDFVVNAVDFSILLSNLDKEGDK